MSYCYLVGFCDLIVIVHYHCIAINIDSIKQMSICCYVHEPFCKIDILKQFYNFTIFIRMIERMQWMYRVFHTKHIIQCVSMCAKLTMCVCVDNKYWTIQETSALAISFNKLHSSFVISIAAIWNDWYLWPLCSINKRYFLERNTNETTTITAGEKKYKHTHDIHTN